MDEADLRALAGLIRSRRTAALGSLQRGAPYVSLVPYAETAGLDGFVLHLSRLAVHTRNLLADPRASLMIAQPDAGDADPQNLMRLSLQATAAPLPRDSTGYGAARERYLAKFPQAAPVFDLGGFDLYHLAPTEGRFIAGFGRIFDVTVDHLRRAAAL